MANSKVKNLNVIKETLSSIINETQFSLNAFVVFKYLTYTSLFQFQKLFRAQAIGNNYFSEYLQKNSGLCHLKNFMFTSHTYVK